MARVSNDGKVWDASTACDVLWVPRSGPFNLENVTASRGSVQALAHELNHGPSAQWLGHGDQNDVLSCSWNKDTESPAGVFSFQLKTRTNYLRKMRPGDLIFIWMDANRREGQRLSGTLVTVGIIDRVSKAASVTGEGAESSTLHVSGRDFGAILQETSTVFDPAFSEVEQDFFNAAFYTQANDTLQRPAMSPLESILFLLHLLYDENASGSKSVGTQWRLPGGDSTSLPLMSFLDVTTFTQLPMFGYRETNDSLSIAQPGNVWNLLQGYSNGVLNEMFVDVRDSSDQEQSLIQHLGDVASSYMRDEDVQAQKTFWDQINTNSVFAQTTADDGEGDATPQLQQTKPILALVLRQRPYDRDAYAKVPVTELLPSEIFDWDVGFAGHDIFNFFRIRFPTIDELFQELFYGIVTNQSSIMRYGLRRLEPETRFPYDTRDFSASSSSGAANPAIFTPSVDYYVGLLKTWHAANERLLSGSISVRFRPDIRVGTRVRFPFGDTEIYDFYVQGVSQQFAFDPGQSRTQLTVTRGVQLIGDDDDQLENNLIWTKGSYSGIPSSKFPGLFQVLSPMIGLDTIESDEQLSAPDAIDKDHKQ